MKRFFRKKEVAAILILLTLFGFSILNLIMEHKDIIWNLKEEASRIRSTNEIDLFPLVVDAQITANIPWKSLNQDAFGMIQRLLFKEEINRFQIIKGTEENLMQVAFYKEDDPELYRYAKRLRRLKEKAEIVGGNVLFVSIPGKSFLINQVSEGLPLIRYESQQDEFLFEAMKNRIEVLDLRLDFKKPNIDKDKVFYQTGKTLSNYGSFQVFCSIVRKLNEQFGLNLDQEGYYCNLDNYQKELYPDAMNGELGRVTGRFYTGAEDYELYYVSKEGNYRWETKMANGKLRVKRGGYYETFFLPEYLTWEDDTADSSYMVLEKSNAWDRLVNLDNPDGAKILLIRDDNMAAVATYLIPLCSKVDMVMGNSSDIGVEEMVETGEYDVILVAFSPEHIKNSYFSFYKDKEG